MTPRTLRPNPTRRLELSDVWRAGRERALKARTKHEQWCRGHGWMLDAGVTDILSPVAYGDSFGDTTFYRFTSLGPDVASRLLETLPEDYLRTERQNDGPTIGSVLRAVVAHPDRLRAHGYLIGPDRCDERITVEGVLARSDRDYRLCNVYGRKLEECDCKELYEWMRDEFGLDAEVFPHELDTFQAFEWGSDGYEGGRWYRAWWD